MAQRILLTGCASGIGRRLSERLAADGHKLVLTDVNLDALGAVAKDNDWSDEQVTLEALDVRDADRWQQVVDAMVARLGGIDVLMNIAGVIRPGKVHELTPDDISFHIDTNTKGVMFGTQAAARHMVERGEGHIINVASLAGISPIPGISLYSASKFAVRGFTLAVAHELRPLGVAVTVVCPDAVQTPMVDLQLDYPDAALTFSSGRMLTADDVVEAIVGRAMKRRPLEITLPWHRALLARLVGFKPSLAAPLIRRLTKAGLKRQAKVKEAGKD